jgi:tRNA/rRNA methyltransferase
MPTPTIILVAPQLGENIGAVARAMKNCGLSTLVLVQPRAGWSFDAALANSAGAEEIIHTAQYPATLADAVGAYQHVYATIAQHRAQDKQWVYPHQAALQMRQQAVPSAIVFGCERAGLSSEEVALCTHALNIPTNPAFSSLNLAQAVLLVGYAWWQLGDVPPLPTRQLASMAEVQSLLDRLNGALAEKGFFTSLEKTPIMQRNLGNALRRGTFSSQEMRTMHGVLTALLKYGSL